MPAHSAFEDRLAITQPKKIVQHFLFIFPENAPNAKIETPCKTEKKNATKFKADSRIIKA